MAFADPIAVEDSTAVTKNFVLQSRLKDGSDWIESTATASDTRRISIRHSNAGPSVVKGAKPVRRHLVQATQEKFNSTLGKTEKLVVNLTITNDPGSTLDNAEAAHLVSFVCDFITQNGYQDKMLRDET